MSTGQPGGPGPMRIAPIGLDNRQRAALEMVFKSKSQNAYQLVEDGTAQALIVDLDHFKGVALAREWEGRWGRRPVLYLSVQEEQKPQEPGSLFLRKPFHIEDFVSILLRLGRLAEQNIRAQPVPSIASPATSRIRVEIHTPPPPVNGKIAADAMAADLRHPFVGTAPDVDLDDPRAREAIYYDPEQYLQGQVERAWKLAQESQTPVGLGPPWPLIKLCPVRGLAGLDMVHTRLRPVASMPNHHADNRLLRLDQDEPLGVETMAFPALQWKLALWASRGRLPRGTPLDVPIFVRHWPNFPRLDVTPWALSITALWTHRPHSLKDTTELLGAPQRYVFAFYSAAHALDIAGPSNRAVDQMFAAEPLPAPPERGLLRRILDHLRR